MKETTEKMAARGVKVLSHSLVRSLEDVNGVFDRFEAEHSNAEREEPKEYGALVAGQF